MQFPEREAAFAFIDWLIDYLFTDHYSFCKQLT